MSAAGLFCGPERRGRGPRVARTHSWIRRLGRRGHFERPPRVLYRRAGERYFEAFALVIVFNGIVVAGCGVVAVVLYVDLTVGQAALFALCWVFGLAVEGAVAAVYFLSATQPARAWFRRGRPAESALPAWSAAAGAPLMLMRRPSLYVLGAVGAAMRPVLRDIGESLTGSHTHFARVSLHQRLLTTVPMVTWGAALVVGGLVTSETRGLETIGRTSLVSLGVTAAFSIWLSLVLGDAVSGPIIDLRNATRRLGSGDLTVTVPVVSTDETGELAAAFNSMVTGLREREQLQEAFGTFVDPGLAERVLTEGTDLRGEEIDASVLFLDVRGFTEFAEHATAQEVVARLNELYEGVVPVIERHGGHANKFMGDALLAVFGAPERHPDHAARALAAAREIAPLVRDRAVGALRVGLGVNSGRVVIGTIGGGSRRDFTVIGDPVNTAARVEAATRLTGDEILITESTLRALGRSPDDFEERPPVPLKGKAATVRLYAPSSRG